MTLSESIAWSFARSVIIASLALWPLATVLHTIDTRATVRSRRFWILLAIFPFFVPELLIGFHYRLAATQLSSGASPIAAAICTESLYAVLQFSRCLAAGVAVALLLPGAQVTEQSLYSWDLLRASLHPWTWRRGWLMLRIRGPWTAMLISWSLMALMAFQEFETAALMQIDRHPVAWSVWLFDAHAARQPIQASLRMVLIPVACELLLLLPALLLLKCRAGLLATPGGISDSLTERVPSKSSRTRTSRGTRTAGRISSDGLPAASCRTENKLAALCLCPAIILFVLWPLLSNLKPMIFGLCSMMSNPSALRQAVQQILTSVGFAIAATIVAMNIAAIVLASPRVRQQTAERFSQMLMTVLAGAGLMGSLVLSVLLLTLFQWPGLRVFYDSWLPMLLGQAIAVLPKALAIGLLLQQVTDESAIFSARLLQQFPDSAVRRSASKTLWRLITSRWLLYGLVVAHWCFWDVTVASILRPVALEPVVTRLYNEMHYGRTEALMSLAGLAALTPIAVWLLAMMASFFRAGWSSQSASRP